jgi:D-amino peptidase
MKKVMIRCDMEGASGIVSYEQAEPGKSEYNEGRLMFMSDLLALIKGLQDGGVDQIYIYDEHYYGRSIMLDKLPENVRLICGKPKYCPDWAGGLDEDFDAMILLGFHSKRGTADALLNHTYEPDIRDIHINGLSVGEIGIEAAIAGDCGVPFVMITADSEGIIEAKKLVPDVVGISVKESLSEFGACCYPLSETYRMINENAKSLAESPCNIKPFIIEGDVELKVTFFDTEFAKKYVKIYGEPIIKGSSTLECWSKYLNNKLEILSL